MMTEQENRILKSVALKAAVEVRKDVENRIGPILVLNPAPEIIKLAKEFEKYLRGEDAK